MIDRVVKGTRRWPGKVLRDNGTGGAISIDVRLMGDGVLAFFARSSAASVNSAQALNRGASG